MLFYHLSHYTFQIPQVDIAPRCSIIYNNNNNTREQASVRENGAVGERDEKRKLRFRYASALKAQFRISFGREANPEEISAMLTALEGMKGLDADLLRYAIRKAAQNGARTPGAYFASLAEYWREYGITNIEQWDEVDYLRQRMAASKGTRFEEVFERQLSELSGKLTGRIRAAAV